MGHLDEHTKSEPKIKACIVDVLSETVLIAAGGSIGKHKIVFPPFQIVKSRTIPTLDLQWLLQVILKLTIKICLPARNKSLKSSDKMWN
jgi:hypothetical protein